MARMSVLTPAFVNPVTHSGAGTNYVVKTLSGVFYLVYINDSLDVVFIKSTDGGMTWGTPVSVFTGSVTSLSIWYDRWSGISAGLIHCAYTESVTDDTLYRSIDTENSDTLGTQTSIFAGGSTAQGGALSITRARGGNLYCKTVIDAGAEGGFFRSVDVGANWTARTDCEALATTDQWALFPGFAADNQDIIIVFLDNSAGELSRYVYDNSADSHAETSIATGITPVAATSSYPHFAGAVDLTNSKIFVTVWNAVDAANADLLAFDVSESAITALGDVVTNSTDDQGLCANGIDTNTGHRHVFYGGLSDGSDSFSAQLSLRYKKSTDGGATWGSETEGHVGRLGMLWLAMTPRFDTTPLVAAYADMGQDGILVNMDVPIAVRPTYALGI